MRKDGGYFFIGAFIIVVAIAFIWIGLHGFLSYQKFSKVAIPGEGTVVEVVRLSYSGSHGKQEIKFSPVVNFQTPDGKTVEFLGVGNRQPQYIIGEKVPIQYDPEKPNNAEIKTTVSGNLILLFPGLGLLFFLIGVAFFVSPIYAERNRKWLFKNGKVITVPVLRVDGIKDSRGTLSYFIVGQWQNPEDQKIYTFFSEQILFDPKSYTVDRQLQIYINPKNPNKYYMDVSFLPEMG